MAVRIPAPLQDLVQTLGLKSWLGGKKFDPTFYYETIDLLALRLMKLDPDGEARDANLANCLAQFFDAEGALLTHVLKNGTAIDDEAKWHKMCLAASWVLVQMYRRAVEKGEWP